MSHSWKKIEDPLERVEEWREEIGCEMGMRRDADFWYTEGVYCAWITSSWRPLNLDPGMKEAFYLGLKDGEGEMNETL